MQEGGLLHQMKVAVGGVWKLDTRSVCLSYLRQQVCVLSVSKSRQGKALRDNRENLRHTNVCLISPKSMEKNVN